MSSLYLKFNSVTFSYEISAEQLFRDISFHVSAGWTGVVGANGTGKTTLLKLATGQLIPEKGNIEFPDNSLYCMQRTDYPPGRMGEFFSSRDKKVNIIKEQLAIKEDWKDRWYTLSHGERKRIQLGTALWLNPDLLAIDEPTNHLDMYARKLIKDALSKYTGVGLLVSHDRELMDRLCNASIFTKPPDVIIRPGGITLAGATFKKEQQAVQKHYDIQKKAVKKLRREAIRRRQEAQQADRKRSKRNIAPKDKDARGKIDLAILTGKDGQAGRLYRQIQTRLSRMQEEFKNIKIEKKQISGIWLPGSVSKRDYILQLPAGSSIRMGKEKKLFFPDLIIKPADRIAITGPNGAGKSTLINYLLGHMNVEQEHITYVPQEIDLQDSKEILGKAKQLQKDKLGHLMTIVSRLNSNPERLLSTAEPSPGETRKLLLALGMTKEPYIIIMDEPTNHMDLPSIECLESALSECPCALVLVSHDTYFLNRLTDINWNLVQLEDKLTYKLEY